MRSSRAHRVPCSVTSTPRLERHVFFHTLCWEKKGTVLAVACKRLLLFKSEGERSHPISTPHTRRSRRWRWRCHGRRRSGRSLRPGEHSRAIARRLSPRTPRSLSTSSSFFPLFFPSPREQKIHKNVRALRNYNQHTTDLPTDATRAGSNTFHRRPGPRRRRSPQAPR